MAPSPPTSAQAKLIRNELLKDKNDLYNRYAWYIVVPGLLIYSLFALLNSHHAEPLQNDGGEVEKGDNLTLTVARDSLLRMTFVKWEMGMGMGMGNEKEKKRKEKRRRRRKRKEK